MNVLDEVLCSKIYNALRMPLKWKDIQFSWRATRMFDYIYDIFGNGLSTYNIVSTIDSENRKRIGEKNLSSPNLIII